MQLHDSTKTSRSPSHWSVIIKNITNHSVTFPFGYIGYIEIPATLEIPSAYQVHVIKSLVRSVFNPYYPNLTEPKPPARSSSISSNLSSSSFEIHNSQPTQIIQHSFPIPPYSKSTLSFLSASTTA